MHASGYPTNPNTPSGFQLSEDRQGSVRLTYQRRGWRRLLILITFMIILLLWFMALTGLMEFENQTSIPDAWIKVIGVLNIIVFAGLLVWMLCEKTHFLLGSDELIIEKDLFGWRRRSGYNKQSIKAVRQVKDDAERDEAFRGWSLIIEGDKGVALLRGQAKETVDWLGPVIAKWASVGYIPWEDPAPPDKPIYG